ncbi:MULTISPECIES: TetR/AcrR family transcriptional regulator [Pseudomonas]|uniref:TetR/AcrR family transcriptional regulator n=1 Tax=Pseudomonas neustonica TaxID=2487346 RepID=A0ABX9XMM7_9PSED|nr:MULTISPECIES: TetR/AcrR family transcriptional regulator [Pseudomonas]MBA6419620.1 TetR/AcrR family transcriptional regulator [Pseudomonas sp. 5Ae-yellow]ROZ87099.1 TetR/AcrR family transcriptional regulator [Pseudomonas sp. SSM44]ROZ88285.1 TetR/AcrR family transcriptional regulator [Pseudomonas neustonica]
MVYRTTATRLERDEVTREHILNCALQQVADSGFGALTMSGLARAAGIATGSLYRHFPGKGALTAEVFVKATRIELNTLKEQFLAPGLAHDRLRNGIAQFAARAWHSRQLAYALIAEPAEEEVETQRLYYRQAYATIYGELLKDGVADGSFVVENIPLTAACLVGAVAESLVGPLSPQARADRESGLPTETLAAVTRTITRFCLRALGAKDLPQ